MRRANASDFRVVIIGAGLGGLCLAQALKSAGVRVAVFERDSAADARPQGTRLHINPTGSAALHTCLPDEVFALFERTSGRHGSTFTVFNKDLHVLSTVSDSEESPLHSHWSVDRMVLRRVLLTGLENRTHFGKTFAHYEELSDGALIACFEDDTRIEADVLVGADGVGSRVREKYLPHTAPFDTGAIMIGAIIPFSDALHAILPKAALTGGVMIVPGDAPCALVLASWTPETRELQALAGMSAIPKVPNAKQNGYAVFGFCAERNYFELSSEQLRTEPAAVKRAVQARMSSWHGDLQALVEIIAPSIQSSRPVDAWRSTGITLIGDAIHSMTPFQGNGANTALKDAETLSRELTAAIKNELPIVEAVQSYERSMRIYAFEAVRESLSVMTRLLGRQL